MSGARPIMRFIAGMLVRVTGGIYTCPTRFRRSSVELVEKKIPPKGITKATVKIKDNCSLKQISFHSVYCIIKGTIRPCLLQLVYINI